MPKISYKQQGVMLLKSLQLFGLLLPSLSFHGFNDKEKLQEMLTDKNQYQHFSQL